MNWFKKLFGCEDAEKNNQTAVGEQENTRNTTIDLMLDEGLTYGEAVSQATGGANLVDGKQTWEHAESAKHDIDAMKKCCDAEIKTFRITGDCPAPYYFLRVAILSRKEKNYAQEVEYCEMYLDLIREIYSRKDMSFEEALENRALNATDSDIYNRLPKAKALLARNKE